MKSEIKSLTERDSICIWHPYSQGFNSTSPVPVVRAERIYLIAENGERYIDGISSWWTNIHGHSNPHISREIALQASELDHVIFAGFTHPPAVQLAERLLNILPENQSRIFYSDDGSTAVEVALKMALQYWTNKGVDRKRIIAFENAYHGDTFGAMSVSARSAFTNPFGDLLFNVDTIPIPSSDDDETPLTLLDNLLKTYNNQYAAFIFEPLVQGAGGMRMYSASALDRIIRYCRGNKIICIADEVMTGFGRTGSFFASDHLKEKPDIFCLSKGLTGGTMPLGATSCSEEIYSAFLSDDKSKTFFHGHSFTANPIACRASLASLDLLTDPACLNAIKRIQNKHRDFIAQIKTYQCVSNPRICGTILAFELGNDTMSDYFHSIRDWLYFYFLEKKILLRPLGNTLYLMPPYCIEDFEFQILYNAITQMLNDFSIKKLNANKSYTPNGTVT
ncbi:MAG: adenosylmethionine--8-amino-7-oxononanoate transaminase [Bacteroidetes bacterium]|nr:MAG: adenosylmethionine--8-amino-7-oxononanoate transaminase [Bacteroidota bacterium]